MSRNVEIMILDDTIDTNIMTWESRVRRLAWSSDELQSAQMVNWRDIVWNNLKDYCESTTLHGYRYLTEPRRHWVERLVWIVVHVLATWGTAYIILDMWRECQNTPTVTTVESTAYPIAKVSFPAVAVCNINKISLSKARRLARDLAASRNVSVDEFFSSLPILGRLYNFDGRNRYKLLKLHEILTAGNNTYNVSQLMGQINPSCDDLLLRCMWQGVVHDCKSLFEERKTMEGYCCTFNYVRHGDNFVIPSHYKTIDFSTDFSDYDTKDERIKSMYSPGYSMGLTLLVNPQIDDYYYPLSPTHGTKVLVYNPRDFPDTASGGLTEKLVSPDTEVFFRLEATSVYSVPAVKDLHLSQRRCLFKNEQSHLFAGSYTYSDCLMNCRARSIEILCNCVPFHFPSTGSSRSCNLLDVQCLAKHKGKWATLRPTQKFPGLESEMEMSLSCSECYPACSDTTYHVQATSSSLAESRYETSDFLDGVSNLTGHSVLHVFFGTHTSTLLKQDVLYHWYDLVSNFGGICGLFVGFSLISVVEFIYFFTFRMFFLLKDNSRVRNDKARNKDIEGRCVYWAEMVPTTRHRRRY